MRLLETSCDFLRLLRRTEGTVPTVRKKTTVIFKKVKRKVKRGGEVPVSEILEAVEEQAMANVVSAGKANDQKKIIDYFKFKWQIKDEEKS